MKKYTKIMYVNIEKSLEKLFEIHEKLRNMKEIRNKENLQKSLQKT